MPGENLHDSIATAFDQVAATTPEPLTPAEPTPSASPASPPGLSPTESPAEESGAGPARDEKGRFASKFSDGTDAPEPGAPAPEAAPIPAPVEASPVDPTLNEAPASWAPERKADWAKVPAEVRSYLHQREGELQQGFQKVAQRANVAEAVLGEFMPYAEQLQREGATPVAAMRTLLQTAHALRTGGAEYKKAIIYSLAQQYGVDLSSAYNPQLAQAEAVAQNLSTEKMYGTAQQQAYEQQAMVQQITAFSADPKNEFFPKVREIMGHLINGGIAKDLPSAYQMALGMHPEVRQELLKRELDARTQGARRTAAASMSVSGAPNGAAAPAPGAKSRSLRDTIAAQMANVNP